jgi:hypothetical protein
MLAHDQECCIGNLQCWQIAVMISPECTPKISLLLLLCLCTQAAACRLRALWVQWSPYAQTVLGRMLGHVQVGWQT